MGPSITLLKLKDGPCIGGFTNANRIAENNPQNISDDTAMLFNLTNSQKFPICS